MLTPVTSPGALRRSTEDERLRRKQRLAAAFRIFARNDYDHGAGGHITARDPELLDHFWINPFGMPFAHIRVSDLLLVDVSGRVVEGEGRINPAGFMIHSRIHEARPEVVSAAHTHSVHGCAFSSLGRLLDPLTQDACAFHEDHGLLDDYTGVVLSPQEGERIVSALGMGKAVILRNHGLLTVGESVDEAAWWFVSMERCCQVQLLAEAAGRPVLVGQEAARATARMMGTPQMGRLNFRPMYDATLRAEPDLMG